MNFGDVPSPPSLHICNSDVEFVDKFTYLGSIITNTSDLQPDINRRIGFATRVMRSLRQPLWRQTSISLETKLRVYQASVLSVLLYRSECWPISTTMCSRLSAFDMQAQRTITNIKWFEYKTTAALNCHRIILLIRNYELLIRNYELLIRNYELVIRNYELLFLLIRNYELVIRNYELVIRNYELVIRNYELVIRNYGLVIRNYGLVIRNYELVRETSTETQRDRHNEKDGSWPRCGVHVNTRLFTTQLCGRTHRYVVRFVFTSVSSCSRL